MRIAEALWMNLEVRGVQFATPAITSIAGKTMGVAPNLLVRLDHGRSTK